MDPSLLFINEESRAIEALSIIDKTSLKIALVINQSKRLIGTVSDGDIRRGILKGKNLNSEIREIMNRKFKYINDFENSSNNLSLINLIKEENLRVIPVLDKKGKVVSLVTSNDLKKNISNNPVVIMAGGKGTRLYPKTANCPKPMLKVAGKPMLEIILENYISYGFKRFFISVFYKKEKIINYFGDGSAWNISIDYLIEKEPLGTAGALSLLPKTISDSLIIINGDVITKLNPLNLLDFHKNNKADATICAAETEFKVPYGVIEIDGIHLNSFQEKPTYKKLINAGIYVLNPKLLSFINSRQYLDMPSLLDKAKLNKKAIIVYPLHEYWIDVGMPDKFDEAQFYLEN